RAVPRVPDQRLEGSKQGALVGFPVVSPTDGLPSTATALFAYQRISECDDRLCERRRIPVGEHETTLFLSHDSLGRLCIGHDHWLPERHIIAKLIRDRRVPARGGVMGHEPDITRRDVSEGLAIFDPATELDGVSYARGSRLLLE